ncbi:hydroxyisourate hydrolase [Pelagibacterium montanilacus]|uniref:hydroxyisourate hydrolase n=1 Tax=Pelagibacterium montanilacus TaxID=2185280 RepID=UPI000F8EB7E2|nr:hydroxyisourate hydrolase [Pelagibacterium montanilacus]
MSGAGRLTTHVLDTAHGHPAAGMRIALYRSDGADPALVTEVVTNGDGRCDGPLLEGGQMVEGQYLLHFSVGDYFAGIEGAKGGFLDVVPVQFTISDPGAHYHVPLLVSPFGYSTYRGS